MHGRGEFIPRRASRRGRRFPDQSIKWADVDADTAVHAQAEVDGELIEDCNRPGSASTGLADLLCVTFERDAPRRAFLDAQHA